MTHPSVSVRGLEQSDPQGSWTMMSIRLAILLASPPPPIWMSGGGIEKSYPQGLSCLIVILAPALRQ